MSFAQSSLVVVTREVEVTPGVVVGGDRDRVYATTPQVTPIGQLITSPITAGLGGVQSVRAGLRAADIMVDSALVYGLNDEEVADFMRDTWPSPVSATGVSVTFANAGTHDDGTTGPTIEGAANDFDDFIGAEGCILLVAGGGVAAPNKWPRMIKKVHADGSQIDLDPYYVTGSASSFGEPLTNEGPVSADLDVGSFIKNRSVTNIRSVNFEFEFADIAGGSFQMFRGLKAGTLRLGFEGKGVWTLGVGYVGMDYDLLTTATQGSGTVNANSAIDNSIMVAGEDLTYFVVGGSSVLSGDNLTQFSIEGNGQASGIDDVAGVRERTGVAVGDIDVTGSLRIYHEHTKMLALQTIARSGGRVPLAWNTQDPDGNQYWGSLPRVVFEGLAPQPGGGGGADLVSGQMNFQAQLGANDSRTLVWQRFAAA